MSTTRVLSSSGHDDDTFLFLFPRLDTSTTIVCKEAAASVVFLRLFPLVTLGDKVQTLAPPRKSNGSLKAFSFLSRFASSFLEYSSPIASV